MVLIRKITQTVVDSFLNCSMMLLPQHLSGDQAACRSLEFTPASLVSTCTRWPLPWDQQSRLDLRVYSQTPVQSHWESQFLGRLISPGVPKERGVWNSQGGRKDKCVCFFSSTFLRLCNKLSCLRTVSGKKKLSD